MLRDKLKEKHEIRRRNVKRNELREKHKKRKENVKHRKKSVNIENCVPLLKQLRRRKKDNIS